MLQLLKFSLLIICLMLLISNNDSLAQCDPDILETSEQNHLTKYSKRQNRCEGFYTSKVSAGTLSVVNFTKGDFIVPQNEEAILVVSPAFSTNQAIYIRSVGIPLKTYYRMDARIEPNGTLNWPVADFLLRNSLDEEDIGVYGWLDDTNKTLVPVIVLHSDDQMNQELNLSLRSSVDVGIVKWRISRTENGECNNYSAWNNTAKTSYSLGEAIYLNLPESSAGEFCVDVAARDANTAEWLRNILIVKLSS